MLYSLKAAASQLQISVSTLRRRLQQHPDIVATIDEKGRLRLCDEQIGELRARVHRSRGSVAPPRAQRSGKSSSTSSGPRRPRHKPTRAAHSRALDRPVCALQPHGGAWSGAACEAIHIIDQSASLPADPLPDDATIRIYSETDLFGPNAQLYEMWVNAVRGALRRGWRVGHIMPLPATEDEAMAIVEHLILKLVGFNGRYELYFLTAPARPGTPPEYLLVPEYAGVEFTAPDAPSWLAPGSERFAALTAEWDRASADSGQQSRRVLHLVDRFPTASSYTFFKRIAQAEANHSVRCMLMHGLSDVLVPIEIHQDRATRARGVGGTAIQIDNILRQKEARVPHFQDQLKQGYIWDACSREGILRFVRDGTISSTDINHMPPGTPSLTEKERRATLDNLIRLLRSHRHRFHLCVLDDEHPADHTWQRAQWMVKAGDRVLIETCSDGGDAGRMQKDIEIEESIMVQGFLRYFRSAIWNRTPYAWRLDDCTRTSWSSSRVITWLESLRDSL